MGPSREISSESRRHCIVGRGERASHRGQRTLYQSGRPGKPDAPDYGRRQRAVEKASHIAGLVNAANRLDAREWSFLEPVERLGSQQSSQPRVLLRRKFMAGRQREIVAIGIVQPPVHGYRFVRSRIQMSLNR